MFGAVVLLVSDENGRRPIIGFLACSYAELSQQWEDWLPLILPDEANIVNVPFGNILNVHVLSKIELACRVLGGFLYDMPNAESMREATRIHLHNSVGQQGMPYYEALTLLLPDDEAGISEIWRETYHRGWESERWTVIVNDLEIGQDVNAKLYIPSYGPVRIGRVLREGGISSQAARIIMSIKRAKKWNEVSWKDIAREAGKELEVIAYRSDPDSPIGMKIIGGDSFAPR
ncbi:MAG: hypothetical protein HGA33_00175 [Candidatus Moranbacteria bacterium]|nr:hypothetical protein [Candidatus Moranbacteria bacterium]